MLLVGNNLVSSSRNNGQQNQNQQNNRPTSTATTSNSTRISDVELFSGFKPAIEACFLDWKDYPIAGVTFGSNAHYLSPFAVFRLPQEEMHAQHSQVRS